MFRIDAEAHMEFDRLIELRVVNFLQNTHRVFVRVRSRFNLFLSRRVFLSNFGHTYPTSMPMLRAVPLTVGIAASRLSAFRPGSFTRAMSSTCFSVTVPT